MKFLLALFVLFGLAGAGVLVSAERFPQAAWLVREVAARTGVQLPAGLVDPKVPVERWKTAPVEKGTVQAAVLATGTLQPVQTVQVSSQVSGQIVAIVADFNAKVSAGEIIARLDPTTFQGRLASAEADLAVAEATIRTKQSALDKAKAEIQKGEEAARDADRALERARQLVKTGSVTERAVEQAEVLARQTKSDVASGRASIAMAEAEVTVSQANVEQKRAAVRIARTDLERTTIKAPIDGVVIDRQVELGQTVAASLSAPTLFIIAAALEEMQLEASIDEADVGRIREGQSVRFTVDAYPGRTFEGKVAQVRRAAKAVQNVVTYTAVVSADNSSMVLFPGMTANVRIIVDERKDVLKVPQAATRFRPNDNPEVGPSATKRVRTVSAAADEGRRTRLYVLRDGDRLEPVEVSVGLSAENMVEVRGDGLGPGDQVVVARANDPNDRRQRAPLGF
ncbi:efflux RND transporter periplasmic adaptor subunit [Prosthecomicrobium sp. N25]|uniref:efflux RND transporter periplasmic adaptor subunit n=1 Tax=Prosthecomicrobium sp. N25 TaxID=3129254 RepID=UPI0030771E02